MHFGVIKSDGHYSTIELINNYDIECTTLNNGNELNHLSQSITNLTGSLTGTMKRTKEMFMAILGFNKATIAACPNKRVAYLAIHAKKKRARIKNRNRAIRILEKAGITDSHINNTKEN